MYESLCMSLTAVVQKQEQDIEALRSGLLGPTDIDLRQIREIEDFPLHLLELLYIRAHIVFDIRAGRLVGAYIENSFPCYTGGPYAGEPLGTSRNGGLP